MLRTPAVGVPVQTVDRDGAITCHSVYAAADNKEATILVGLHMSAAFDAINHDVLISRLMNQFGVVRSAATIRAVEVAGSRLQIAPKLKSLGVTIDSRLRFDCHAKDVARACNYHTRALRPVSYTHLTLPTNREV